MGTLIGVKVCLGALVRARVYLGSAVLIGSKRFALVWVCLLGRFGWFGLGFAWALWLGLGFAIALCLGLGFIWARVACLGTLTGVKVCLGALVRVRVRVGFIFGARVV